MPDLDVRGLTVTRGGRRVLDEVSFCARGGEIFVVLGPNGAGKTTLLEALIGALRADERHVRLDGEPLADFEASARAFAYMPDEAQLPEEASVETILERASVELLGVKALLERHAGTLSRGEAKRVWLAWAMGLGRPVLVLDEPFGAFDPLQLDDVIAAVKGRAESGTIVIATVHQMAIAERIADRLLLLADGRAVAGGTFAELRERAGAPDASLEDVFRALLAKEDR